MRYYPALLDLRGRCCVVVGGGRVAERKVQSLRGAGGRVTVVSPDLTRTLEKLRGATEIRHRARFYRRGDLKDASLAIAATDDPETNERVFREATDRRIPVNVVDDPDHSSFIVPSLVQRGDLLVAISTSGKSPALAKALREKLGKEIGGEYAFFLKLLGKVRQKILSGSFPREKKRKIFRQIVREDLAECIRRKDRPRLEARLRKILGPGFSLKELELRL